MASLLASRTMWLLLALQAPFTWRSRLHHYCGGDDVVRSDLKRLELFALIDDWDIDQGLIRAKTTNKGRAFLARWRRASVATLEKELEAI